MTLENLSAARFLSDKEEGYEDFSFEQPPQPLDTSHDTHPSQRVTEQAQPTMPPSQVLPTCAPSPTEDSMLQQQRAILQKVLDSQKALEKRQDDFETKLACLQSEVRKPSSAVVTLPSLSSDGRRK